MSTTRESAATATVHEEVPAPSTWSRAARRSAATALVVSPLLALAAFLTAPTFEERAARLADVARDPGPYQLASALFIASFPFTLGAVVVKMLLARKGSPRLAWAGGVLAAAGVLGHAVVAGIELMTDAAVAGGLDVGDVVRVDAEISGAGVIVAAIMFLPFTLLGFVLLAAALWRSRAVPIGVLLLLAGLLVLDLAVDQPVAGYACLLAAHVWIAAVVLRGGYQRPRRIRSKG